MARPPASFSRPVASRLPSSRIHPMKTLVSAHTICLALLLLFIVRGASAGPAAVAMPDRYAAAAAEKILREGGNAVDAAVTAVFVLAVTYPEAAWYKGVTPEDAEEIVSDHLDDGEPLERLALPDED